MLFTCGREVWSFVFDRPVDGFWPLDNDALVTQDIAHFFNLSKGFFQVVRRKRLAPMLLVEGPVLLVCVGLIRPSRQGDTQLISLSHFYNLRFVDGSEETLTFTSTVNGGTWAFSARPTITSSRGSHSL